MFNGNKYRNALSFLQVYDQHTGRFLQFVNTAADPLVGPQGLALSPDQKHIFIADSGNFCIKCFPYI